jgi:hypothetical protein
MDDIPSPGGEGQVEGELTSLNKILEPFLAAKERAEHKDFYRVKLRHAAGCEIHESHEIKPARNVPGAVGATSL